MESIGYTYIIHISHHGVEKYWVYTLYIYPSRCGKVLGIHTLYNIHHGVEKKY